MRADRHILMGCVLKHAIYLEGRIHTEHLVHFKHRIHVEGLLSEYRVQFVLLIHANVLTGRIYPHQNPFPFSGLSKCRQEGEC